RRARWLHAAREAHNKRRQPWGARRGNQQGERLADMEANQDSGCHAIRIVVASDIRLYRDVLERAFRDASGIDLVGAVSGAEDTLKQVELVRPDIVLLDMSMPDAFALAKQIHRVSRATRIVALGMPEVEAEIIACAEMGIAGYVPRGGSLDDAFETVH